MIVNRRTYTVKPGRGPALIEILKVGGTYLANMPTFRIYQALLGESSRVVLELDFDDLAHYERFWTAWDATPESAQVVSRFNQEIETGTSNEIWQLC